mmetsp:Transcript_40608/g.105024  ORF Transcript_40608/g.105024 Transcript_40608/m.105024 type:complete len:138 (+) Transcript_40608:260-673(+)
MRVDLNVVAQRYWLSDSACLDKTLACTACADAIDPTMGTGTGGGELQATVEGFAVVPVRPRPSGITVATSESDMVQNLCVLARKESRVQKFLDGIWRVFTHFLLKSAGLPADGKTGVTGQRTGKHSQCCPRVPTQHL